MVKQAKNEAGTVANFPLLRSAFGLRQATSDETAGGGPLALATAELIADYAGPVVIFDGTGAVLTANGLAKPVLAALDGVAGMGLRSILEDVLQGGGVTSKRFQLPIPTGEGVFDIILLPEGGANGGVPDRVLLLARDSTFDVNFGRALVASRQMFKDLVAYSADFVGETDAEGCFTFVSGRGLLGYSPDELDGRPARDLLVDQSADPGADDGQEAPLSPFESLTHLDEVECWLLNRDDEQICVRASCLPVFDDDGGVVGTGQTPLPVRVLSPGSETLFTISLPDAERINRYRISFMQGPDRVPHVDRRRPNDLARTAMLAPTGDRP